jgi:hypothetical protein
LEASRAAWNATALKIHLYKTNVTPTTSSVVGDFTEADFPGYAAQDVITWGAASVAGHVATITAASNTFTRSTTGAAQNIYGYYVTNAAGTVLYWAELDPAAPRIVTNAGDTISVTLAMTDQSA